VEGNDGWREAGRSGGGRRATVVQQRRRNSAMEDDGAEVEDGRGGMGRGVHFSFLFLAGLNPTSILPSTILPKKGGNFFYFWGRFLLQLR
jgi:hypothetical protein